MQDSRPAIANINGFRCRENSQSDKLEVRKNGI